MEHITYIQSSFRHLSHLHDRVYASSNTVIDFHLLSVFGSRTEDPRSKDVE